MDNSKTGDGPVKKLERITGLDILRGIALFGILIANVHQMFLPSDYANDPVAVIANESWVWLEWSIFYTLIDYKFLTVFSLLFGVGFALQWQRSELTPKDFRRIYLRRLAALAIFGIIHALYLYAADVLFIYASTGLLMVFAIKWSARRLMLVGYGLVLSMLLWSFSLSALNSAAITKTAIGFTSIGVGLWLVRKTSAVRILILGAALLAANAGYQVLSVGLDGGSVGNYAKRVAAAEAVMELGADEITIGGVSYTLPLSEDDFAKLRETETSAAEDAQIETLAYRMGPGWLTVDFRLNAFLQLQFFSVFYLMWRTLGIFMIGAGLVKWGVLSPQRQYIWRKAAIWGLLLGLPISGLATFWKASSFSNDAAYLGLEYILHTSSAYLLGFAFAALVLLWSQTSSLAWLQRAFAAAGRMALTNYIGQSAVMAVLATWYGLSLYATLSHIETMALAALVFAGLMVLSNIWLKSFRIGPLEWIWRMVTYWKRVPIKA